ncbi:hypothetical protein AVEN_227149-1 [Araneus ventricosus]|uniref:Uncharacterized protein n=1 Tax=Araneus ventricosus TaxID=182803 RepID=A0A4Y2BUP6_ARAVE|nr:hypothetical protein AVEN_227149-1 [Araneus ventricosus]
MVLNLTNLTPALKLTMSQEQRDDINPNLQSKGLSPVFGGCPFSCFRILAPLQERRYSLLNLISNHRKTYNLQQHGQYVFRNRNAYDLTQKKENNTMISRFNHRYCPVSAAYLRILLWFGLRSLFIGSQRHVTSLASE